MLDAHGWDGLHYVSFALKPGVNHTEWNLEGIIKLNIESYRNKLWVCFWIYYFIGTVSLSWLGKWIVYVVFHPKMIMKYGYAINPYLGTFLLSILLAVYFFWAWSKVWVNAFNTSRVWFGYTARTLSSVHAGYSYILVLQGIYYSAGRI